MEGRLVTLQIKSHPKNAALIGLAANAYCSHFFRNEFSEEVELAVVEALNNVIEHSYKGKWDQLIKVCFEILETGVVCKIRDYGEQWEWQPSIQSPDMNVPLEDLPEGGFGLFLVQQTMDKVHLEKCDPGSQLVLEKVSKFKARNL